MRGEEILNYYYFFFDSQESESQEFDSQEQYLGRKKYLTFSEMEKRNVKILETKGGGRNDFFLLCFTNEKKR